MPEARSAGLLGWSNLELAIQGDIQQAIQCTDDEGSSGCMAGLVRR
jgi:hypothetical protein